MRRAPSCLLLASALFFSCSAMAQDFGFIDANGLPAPSTPGTFQSLTPANALSPGEVSPGLRVSYLLDPIGGNQPSPDPSGTQTPVVEHLLLAEVLFGVGITGGLDAGLAVPIHVVQSGIALAGIGVGQELSRFAGGDPRLTVGYELPVPLALRTYVTAYLPLGDEKNFAGERSVRFDLGLAGSFRFGRFELGIDLSARLRETSTISTTTWGPQARLGLGGGFDLTEALSVGLEVALAPTLFVQPATGTPPSGYLFPAETLGSVRYRVLDWSLGGAIGTGLPLSIPSGQSPRVGLRRGPTSPLLRIGLELRRTF